MKNYSIGKAARFLNISNELLRHYERLGLIEPERASNGYRFFSYREIDKLQGIRRYRNMGFSLNETERLICSAGEQEVSALLQTSCERMRRDLLWKEELLTSTEHILREWNALKENMAVCRLSVSPEILHISLRSNGVFDETVVPEDVEEWMERLPVVFISPLFPLQGIEQGTDDICFGYGVELSAFGRIGLHHIAQETLIPRRKAVTLVVESAGDDHVSCRKLEPMLKFCREQGLTPIGDAWGITLGNCMQDGISHRYHRVFLPIA